MSNIPKITDPNQVWIAPSWNLKEHMAMALCEYVKALNEILEMAILRQNVTQAQKDRLDASMLRVHAVVGAIPTNLIMTGEPPLS